MPELSVIIPCYNAAAFIGPNLELLSRYLSTKFSSFEIIAVNDGSRDQTLSLLQSMQTDTLKVLNLDPNQGKYGAIKAGMREAQGQVRIFTDADLPFDLAAISYAHGLIKTQGFHLVLGDRTLKESEYEEGVPKSRQLISAALRFLIRIINTGEIHDPQCGFKGFRGDVADLLFPLVRFNRFAGDIELIYVALKYNLSPKRIPVRLRRQGPSSVGTLSTSLEIAACCSSLWLAWRLGRYNSTALEQLGSQRYWETESGA